VKAVQGPHQSAQKYTPMEVRPARTVPVGMTLPVGILRSKVEYPCVLCTVSTGPKISNQWPTGLRARWCESDGPRPPGTAAGVSCQDVAAAFLMEAVAALMASLIVAWRSGDGETTT
jgi:hypothetical protein